jgi:hypothetical protein
MSIFLAIRMTTYCHFHFHSKFILTYSECAHFIDLRDECEAATKFSDFKPIGQIASLVSFIIEELKNFP